MSAAASPAKPLSPTADEIRRAFVSGFPLVYVVTSEEERAVELIRAAADRALGDYEFRQWSATTGLAASGKTDAKTHDPVAALDKVVGGSEAGVYVFKDLHRWLDQRDVVRRLREAYQAGRATQRFVVMLCPQFTLPLELKKETAVVDMPPPSVTELEPIFDSAVADSPHAATEIEPTLRTQFIRALQGLTENESRHLLAKVLAESSPDSTAIEAIQLEKARLIRKEGVLQFFPHDINLDDVGGLENLKDWLIKRKKLFLGDPAEVGDMMPRGLLMMGISGCGKSLSVKAISAYWELPLFRLDMNEVYSGAHGSPEDSFTRALRAAEAFAPCVLWIDEIEGGITGYESEQGGATWRVFSTFLTWMQEKKAPVFVAATANRIDLLPAEILRKGRFDQIFFIDIPSESDREEIFRVHLENRDNELDKFDLSILSRGTKGWNGAEIEQSVVAAMVEAYAAGRTMEKDDIYEQLSAIVPLSTTMAEQIKAIRSWAHDRAIKAGK